MTHKRLLYIAANLLAAVVLVLLWIDPARPLLPVLVLLVLSVACAFAPRWIK